MIVNHSEHCRELGFDVLSQLLVADSWAAEVVQLCDEFW